MDVDIIERIEEKYLITKEEKDNLLRSIKIHLEKDQFFSEEVLSLYFDTKTNDLVIESIDRPAFREKFRLRAYNVPTRNSKIFFEVKTKLSKGRIKISNKRRLIISLKDFYEFYEKGEKLSNLIKKSSDNNPRQVQIAEELDYLVKFYNLEPKLIIASDRTAYAGKNDKKFRLTFDENLRFRDENLKLEKGGLGEKYFPYTSDPKRCIIMEVKTMNAMPIWFVRELSRLKIYPSRFSKYGKIYQYLNERKRNV
ncbi:polyphosphate polymerase domain-containing protein [Candidatus Saccharibacteria bacterium]|nr:polyphosphate polymerase domain-containing protein [Candidatus Saccharibacteria bacterium]